MTLEQLYSVQNDNAKIRSLYLELAQVEDFNPYKANKISDMPRGSGNGVNFADWWISEKKRIKDDIAFWQKKLQRDRKMVEDYIATSPHPEQEIIRYRVINNLGWGEIGEELHIDRRTASRKFYNYLNSFQEKESCPQCPQ